MSNKFVFHYTVGNKLPLISGADALFPTGVKIAPKELPVLWFSAEQVYEPTAIKMVSLPGTNRLQRPTKEFLHDMIGLYRFGLEANDRRLLAWPVVQRKAKIPAPAVASMIRAGFEVGAKPMNWFGAMEEISLREVQFEAWDGAEWQPASIDRAIESVAEKISRVRSISAGDYGATNVKAGWQEPSIDGPTP